MDSGLAAARRPGMTSWGRIDSLPGRHLRVFEDEAVGPQPRRKADPLRRHRLARLVLRPAIEFGGAEPFRRALPVTNRMARIAPPVVAIDRGREAGLVVAVDMHRRLQRQPHADEAGLG